MCVSDVRCGRPGFVLFFFPAHRQHLSALIHQSKKAAAGRAVNQKAANRWAAGADGSNDARK